MQSAVPVFCLRLFVLAGFIPTAVPAQRMADITDWPPVFEEFYGNPEIHIRSKEKEKPKIRFVRPPVGKIVILGCDPETTSADELYQRAIDYFLNLTWDQHLSPKAQTVNDQALNMVEIYPLDRAEFLRIGRIYLHGKSTGNPVADAWWKVRMGKPLTLADEHLAVLNTLSWAESEKDGIGHFSLAVRRRGGSPDSDFIIDFRGPWLEDDRPSLSDALSVKENNEALYENYYDWLYTQIAYRHLRVRSVFFPIAEEQITLLRSLRGRTHDGGEYRLLKGNCSSLGIAFINRLLPLNQRIPGSDSPADLPNQKIQKAVRTMGGTVETVVHDSITLELGREVSHNNQTRPALPSRNASVSYLRLLKVDAIN